MYTPPQSFLDRLESTFDGRLRIRWSIAKHEYHIEQKVGRAALPPFRISEIDDRMIRARDGYVFIMAVKAGNHTDCKTCGLTCRVPELYTGDINCDYCARVKQRRGREFGGYWPLNDLLIDHLKKISPEQDGHLNNIKEQDLALARREAGLRRETLNTVEASTKDDKYRLFQIPFSGYTGKVHPGSSLNGKTI